MGLRIQQDTERDELEDLRRAIVLMARQYLERKGVTKAGIGSSETVAVKNGVKESPFFIFFGYDIAQLGALMSK